MIRDVLASEVAAILGVSCEEIDPSRDLNDYGLDSVDAIVIAGVLGERLRIDLPPELLIQYRSFDDVVSAVSEQLCARGSAVSVEVSPVFLFAGWGGRDARLARLAAHCGNRVPSRPVMIGAWQDWVRNGMHFPDLVAKACDQIEAISPTGLLRLAGYSQGASLAFAVALELERKGRVVASLSIFDARMEARPPTPAELSDADDGEGKSLVRLALRPVRFLWRWMASLARPGRVVGTLRVRLAIEVFRRLPRPAASVLIGALARAPVLLMGRGGTRVDNLLQMYVFALLWADWLPKASALQNPHCRVLLFRSEDAEASDLGWGAYARSVMIIPVSGDHQTMFDTQYIDALAAKFVAAISDVDFCDAENTIT